MRTLFYCDMEIGYYVMSGVEIDIHPSNIEYFMTAEEHELLLTSCEDEPIDVNFYRNEDRDISIDYVCCDGIEIRKFSKYFEKKLIEAIEENWDKIVKENED